MNVNNMFINKSKQSKDLDIFTGKEGYGLFSNKKLDVLILFAFAFMGVLIKLLFNTKVDNSGDQGSASGTIWGYGLSVISMLCILFINIGLEDKKTMDDKKFDMSTILSVFQNHLVYIFVILLLVFVIVMNYYFYTKINRGIIPLQFTNYNFVSGLLILVQFGILYQYLNIDILKFGVSQGDNKNKGLLRTLTYLLSVVNAIFIVIMYILLNYYSTDG